MLGLLTFFLSFHMLMSGKTGSHSLWMMATLIKGDTPFPEFSAVVLLDDIQVMYYDTIVNKLVYKGKNKAAISDFEYVGHIIGYLTEHMRHRAYYLKNHLNDTNNIFFFQRASGCELRNDGQQGGLISRDAYNGECGDARHYNPEFNTLHTDRVWPEAVDSNWPDNFHFMFEYIFHPNCISRLQKHLVNERNRVLKKVKPKVRILQKRGPGSKVLLTCLATGFYPRHINLTLLRDGQPVPDHQITGGELLPNGDETYQMRKSLKVSTEELQQQHYTCTAQHLSLDNKLDVHLEHDWDTVTTSILSSVLIPVFLCLLGVLIMCARKHKGGCCQMKKFSAAPSGCCQMKKFSAAPNSDDMEEIESISIGEQEKDNSLET